MTEVRKSQTTVAAFKQSCNNFTTNKLTNARIMKHLNTKKSLYPIWKAAGFH